MKTDGSDRYYQPVGLAMLRAVVTNYNKMGLTLAPWPSENADYPSLVNWLASAWAQEPVVEAVTLASPTLATKIGATIAGRRTDQRQLKRMALALARYLVRMRGRATPFGIFAGVANARFGNHLSIHWTENHQTTTRADACWLAHIVKRLENCAPLRDRLPVMMNNLVVVRGGRLVVTWTPQESGSDSQHEVSIRLSPVVQSLMNLTRSPMRVGELVNKLAVEHPGASVGGLRVMVGELINRGALISSLRAPSNEVDALAYLLDRLDEINAADLPEIRTLVVDLKAVHQQLQQTDSRGSWAEGRDRRKTAARMQSLSKTAFPPITVDLRIGGELVLPQAVADEAARAAEALIRLSSAPEGNLSWREYHSRFLSRYGPGTPVVVEQLIDPSRGLGLPLHFTQTYPNSREFSLRDQAMLALAQQAALDDVLEVDIDENLLTELTDDIHHRPVSPVDLWIDVRANTMTALHQGEFTSVVRGFGRFATNIGRFLHLLDEPVQKQVTELCAELSTSVQDAVAAQLSFPPRQVRQENVQRVPTVFPNVITLGEHVKPSNNQISVGDLAVVADQKRLYLVSMSRRQVIEPMLPHAGARHTMPPLARLLFEIPRSAHPQVGCFDWGAANCLPFLPRLRYGRSILAPARWRLNPADLPNPKTSQSDWNEAFEAVRTRLRLPVNLMVGSGDRQLRLSLDEPMDRVLLRANLETAGGAVTVSEGPAAADHGWFGERAHEIVVPLAATASPNDAPNLLRSSPPLSLTASEPREDVVYAKLYGPPELVDFLLVEHLPQLLSHWDIPPKWWFVRYRHPFPHLRLRVHATDTAHASGLVVAWAQGLRERALIREISFDTYQAETGRYGTDETMTAAEALFAADSAAALTQLTALSVARHLHPQALAAASLVNLTVAMTGSRTAGMRWLADHPELAKDARIQDREILRQTLQIADNPHCVPNGEAIATAWTARSRAANRYATSLSSKPNRLTPASVLTALLHMHHVRVLDIGAAAEGTTHKLARAVALAERARRSTAKGESD